MQDYFSLREQVYEYVAKKYDTRPEYLWLRYPDYVVFRHSDNRKWYGIIMDIPRDRLGARGKERVDVLNVKLDDPLLVELLTEQTGYYRGYHIARGSWVSILLDGSVPFADVCKWIDHSYAVTASRQKKQRIRPSKEWLIPANPKYYDVMSAFDHREEIEWKQGAGIKAGDLVYLYVAAPISAVLYRCLVTETNIPYDYHDESLSITMLMKIKLQQKYDTTAFTFEKLRDGYGIFAIRGPRGIPNSLSVALREYTPQQR